jgi:hypothetical protein
MLTKEFVHIIKELINSYESLSGGGDAHHEIILWRERFLSSIPKYDDEEKDTYVRSNFMTLHCTNLKIMSPDVLISKLAESWKKDETKPT